MLLYSLDQMEQTLRQAGVCVCVCVCERERERECVRKCTLYGYGPDMNAIVGF